MWEQIRANRRRSFVLLVGMLLLLGAVGFVIGEAAIGQGFGIFGILAALVIWLFQLLLYFTAAESIIMSGLGARQVSRDDVPRLFNIVEEMKLASGFEGDPRIYLIDEQAPNAFAVGRKPEKSAIAVTTGLLYRLNRDELQGVIAHEMAHLKNRDTQFMTLAGVTLGTIVLLAEGMRSVFRMGAYRARSRSSSRNSGGVGGHPALLLVALLVAILAPLLAQMFYFACSRSREYLADASGAQFTRYPEGLASALEKIARAAPGLMVNRVVAPMFIVNPLRAADGESHGLLSTHPPTGKRIAVLRAMAGASVADYEAAYQQATGKRLLGRQTLAAAEPASIRYPSDEGPVEQRHEAKTTIQRLYGYIEVECGCGMVMRVPEMFENDAVNCIRCGTPLALPSAKERLARYVEKTKPVENRRSAEPLEFTRKSNGWESFRCDCGGTVQLSPRFSGRHTWCPKCNRQINILSPSEMV